MLLPIPQCACPIHAGPRCVPHCIAWSSKLYYPTPANDCCRAPHAPDRRRSNACCSGARTCQAPGATRGGRGSCTAGAACKIRGGRFRRRCSGGSSRRRAGLAGSSRRRAARCASASSVRSAAARAAGIASRVLRWHAPPCSLLRCLLSQQQQLSWSLPMSCSACSTAPWRPRRPVARGADACGGRIQGLQPGTGNAAAVTPAAAAAAAAAATAAAASSLSSVQAGRECGALFRLRLLSQWCCLHASAGPAPCAARPHPPPPPPPPPPCPSAHHRTLGWVKPLRRFSITSVATRPSTSNRAALACRSASSGGELAGRCCAVEGLGGPCAFPGGPRRPGHGWLAGWLEQAGLPPPALGQWAPRRRCLLCSSAPSPCCWCASPSSCV